MHIHPAPPGQTALKTSQIARPARHQRAAGGRCLYAVANVGRGADARCRSAMENNGQSRFPGLAAGRILSSRLIMPRHWEHCVALTSRYPNWRWGRPCKGFEAARIKPRVPAPVAPVLPPKEQGRGRPMPTLPIRFASG